MSATLDESERWVSIPGYSFYDASTFGRIRTWRKYPCGHRDVRANEPRVLKPILDTKNQKLPYPKVSVRDDAGRLRKVFVHHLVLFAFEGPRPHGAQARHFPDRERTNTRPENLAWGTPLENAADKRTHGTVAVGDRHGRHTMPHRTARGDRHSSRTCPERMARGASHNSRTKPETVLRGERHGCARLTWAAVKLCRFLHAVHKTTYRDLASWMGVSKSAVGHAITGRRWGGVLEP